MKKISQEGLKEILEKHSLWLLEKEGGERADLRGIDLCDTDLRGIDLCDTDLRGANLCNADLRYTSLGY